MQVIFWVINLIKSESRYFCKDLRPTCQIPRLHFLDLHLSISDGFVKTKIYDKRDDFDFHIVNIHF